MLRHCRGPFHAIVRSVRQQSHGNNSNNTTAGASHYVPPYTLEETFFALVISLRSHCVWVIKVNYGSKWVGGGRGEGAAKQPKRKWRRRKTLLCRPSGDRGEGKISLLWSK